MVEFILDKLIEYFPQVMGYTILVVIVAFIVWKVSKFYFETSKSNSKLPLIENSLKKIEQCLATLNQVLLEKSVISQSVFSNGNSPRVVNAIGNKLYTQSGSDKLYQNIKPKLVEDLDKQKFDSLLELERACLNVLLARMNEPEFKDVQNFAFEHPNFEGNQLSYTDILFIISLKLRDDYRKTHTELESLPE